MNSLVVPIRFKRPTVSHISPSAKEFLREVCEAIWKGSSVDCNFLSAYPITNPRDFPADTLVEYIGSCLADNGPTDLLLIDVGGVRNFELLQPNFILGLTASIASAKYYESNLEIMLMLPCALDESDFSWPLLAEVIENQKISIFYYDQRVLVSTRLSQTEMDAASADIIRALLSTEAKSEFLLAKKMVCHIGNFEIPDRGKRVHDYYEGDFASSQIYEIARARLAQLLETRTSIRVLIDDRGSNWFVTPVITAVNFFEDKIEYLRCSDESTFGSDGPQDLDLVMLPLCRTGGSATTLLEKLKYGSIKDKPEVLALVNVSNDTTQPNSRKLVLSDGTAVEVSTIVRLGERASLFEKIWGDKVNPPIKTNDIDLAGVFPSDSMWGMIYEAGLESETYVPGTRPSLGTVPNYRKLIELNGPLFAAKIHRATSAFFRPDIGRNFAFLHPDEDAANELASCVFDLADLDSIAIRSRLIELASHCDAIEDLLQRCEAEGKELSEYAAITTSQLRMATQNATADSSEPFRVVILSEFQASGSRVLGLIKLAELFGWEVLCSVCLGTMFAQEKLGLVKNYSFYNFGYIQRAGRTV